MNNLILSIFPGIGVLDRGFELEGYCVVRGPDLIWGGDIRSFHAPAGIFAGIIGGPPCQVFSVTKSFNPHVGKKSGNMIPDFERIVREAKPDWFLMENIRGAPIPEIKGFVVDARLFNNRWIGEVQNRVHRFSFGTKSGLKLLWEEAVFLNPKKDTRLLASDGRRGLTQAFKGHKGRSVSQALELQGLPADYLDHCPFTARGKVEVLGNAVPFPLAKALAKAVKRALTHEC